MLDSNFFITLIGLFVTVFAISNINSKKSVSEGFFPSRSVRVVKSSQPQERFFSEASLKPILPPRFSAQGGYGFQIGSKLNVPYSKSAVPKHPLGFEDMQSDSNDFEEDSDEYKPPPAIYDRFIVAPAKSNLRRHADPIRGDVPGCIPNTVGLFNVFPTSNDVHHGVLNVIGGVSQTVMDMTSEHLAKTNGYDTVIGGVNMDSQFPTYLGASGGDIRVASFH
jgi:hypothetical protein